MRYDWCRLIVDVILFLFYFSLWLERSACLQINVSLLLGLVLFCHVKLWKHITNRCKASQKINNFKTTLLIIQITLSWSNKTRTHFYFILFSKAFCTHLDLTVSADMTQLLQIQRSMWITTAGWFDRKRDIFSSSCINMSCFVDVGEFVGLFSTVPFHIGCINLICNAAVCFV